MTSPDAGGHSMPPRRCTFQAIAGAWFFCILLPCFLLWWHNHGQLQVFGRESEWALSHFVLLLITAGILLTPGTLILAYIAIRLLRSGLPARDDYHENMRNGSMLGAALGFCNFPGYLGILHLSTSSYPVLRLIVLYGVTGGLCGAWVGWQAFREWHAEARFFPHFSLRTLVLFVLAWGILAGIFMPR